MLIVCPEVNRTRRAYEVISHPEVFLDLKSDTTRLMRIKQIRFQAEFNDLFGTNKISSFILILYPGWIKPNKLFIISYIY